MKGQEHMDNIKMEKEILKELKRSARDKKTQ